MELAVADSLKDRVILGLDALEVNRCTIDAGSRILRFGKQEFSVALEIAAPLPPVKSRILVLHETLMQIPVFSEAEVMARADHTLSNSAWLVEGTSDQKSPLILTIVIVSSPQGESLVASSPADGCVMIVLQSGCGPSRATLHHLG